MNNSSRTLEISIPHSKYGRIVQVCPLCPSRNRKSLTRHSFIHPPTMKTFFATLALLCLAAAQVEEPACAAGDFDCFCNQFASILGGMRVNLAEAQGVCIASIEMNMISSTIDGIQSVSPLTRSALFSFERLNADNVALNLGILCWSGFFFWLTIWPRRDSNNDPTHFTICGRNQQPNNQCS